MGIPQQDSAVFYHPLDDRRAGLAPAKWSGGAGFAPGTVDDAAFGLPSGEIVFAAPSGSGGSGGVADLRDDPDSFVMVYATMVGVDDYRARARLGSIDADDMVTYGAEYDFFMSTKSPGHFRVNWLDSSRFLVSWRRGYQDPGGEYQALGIVGVVAGGDVTFGAQEVLGDPAPQFGPQIEVAVLSDAKVVYVFYQIQNPNYAWSVVVNIAADVLTVGGAQQISDITMGGGNTVAEGVDATTLVIVNPAGVYGSPLRTRVGTVAGTDVTWGLWQNLATAAGSPGYTRIKAVESIGGSKLLFCYVVQLASSWETRVRVGVVAGADITFGPVTVLHSGVDEANGGVDGAWMSLLDAETFVLAYCKTASPTYAKVCTMAGGVVEIGGTPNEVTGGNLGYQDDVFGRGPRSFLVAYGNSAKVGNLLGDVSLGYEAGVSDFDSPDNEFLAAGMAHPAMVLLDPTTLVVAYSDTNNSNHGTVKLGTIAEDEVTFGSPHEFLGADGAVQIALAALDSTHFVVAYNDQSDSAHGTCKVGVALGGDDVTFGAEYEFLAGPTNTPTLAALGADKFVVGYRDGVSTQTAVRVGEVGGMVGLDITWGNVGVLQISITTVDVAATDPTTFVAVYGTHARLCTVAGSTVTLGAEVSGVRAGSSQLSVEALTETSVATCYTSGGIGYAQVLAVSGGTVEPGPEVIFSAAAGNMGLAALDSAHIVLCYQGAGTEFSAKGGTVAGMSATFGSAREVAAPVHIAFFGDMRAPVAGLAGGRFAVAHGNTYGDDGVLAPAEYSGHVRIGETDFSGVEVLDRFGAAAEFSADEAPYTTAALLTASSAVVTYMDTDNSGKVAIATISGTDVVFGAPAQFHANARETTVVVLDTTHFVVCFADAGDALRGKAVTGTVSGADITYGPLREFNGGATGSIAVSMLDSGHFVVCYQNGDTSGRGTAKVGIVAGSTVSFGAAAEFTTGVPMSSARAAALSVSTFVVAYTDGGDSNKPKAKVGSVSGETIIFGFETDIQATAADPRAIAKLDASRVAVAYLDPLDLAHGRVKVGTVAAADITFGAESVMDGACQENGLVALGSQRLAAVEGGYGDMRGRIASVAGAAVAWDAASVLLAGTDSLNYIAATTVDASRFIVHYNNVTASKGRAKVGILGREAHPTAIDATKVAFASWIGSSDDAGPTTTLPPSEAPAVDAPLYDGMTSASGTSSEADGTEIQVYHNGTPLGSTVAVSGGAWTKPLGLTLAAGHSVAAKSRASGESWSPLSASVAVTSPLQEGGWFSAFSYGSQAFPYVAACGLSTDKFLVAYQKPGSSPGDACRVVTVTGTSTSLGDEQLTPWSSSWDEWDEVVALSSTKVVALNPLDGKAAVGDITGDTVVWGAVNSSAPEGTRVAAVAVDASHLVVVASDVLVGPGACAVGTVTGDAVAFGPAQSLPFSSFDISLALVAASTVVAVGNTSYTGSPPVHACAGTVSGTSVAWGTHAVLAATSYPPAQNDSKRRTSVAAAGPGKFVAMWASTGQSWMSKVGNVSGNTITPSGTGNSVESGFSPLYHCDLTALTGGKVMAVYGYSEGTGYWLHGKAGDVAGTAPNEYVQWDQYRTLINHNPAGYRYSGLYAIPLDATHAAFFWGETRNGAGSARVVGEIVWPTV